MPAMAVRTSSDGNVMNADAVTPHSEAFQAVIWHLLVTHPALKANQTKWESAAAVK